MNSQTYLKKLTACYILKTTESIFKEWLIQPSHNEHGFPALCG